MPGGDGQYPRLLACLAKADVQLIDDWDLEDPNTEIRRDLLELLKDWYVVRST